MPTAPFCSGDPQKAKVLVIGHDPRLREAQILANHAFFADYYFKPIPTRINERAKYNLAEAVFNYIGHLTSYKYCADRIVLTNLCNEGLPRTPRGTVYIPEEKAIQGISEIRNILNGSDIEIIFAMSAQVNYWLQKLGFYPAVDKYISAAEPKKRGVINEPPYYVQTLAKAFIMICGKRYHTGDDRIVVPILHVRNWPLRGPFARAYAKSVEACINALK